MIPQYYSTTSPACQQLYDKKSIFVCLHEKKVHFCPFFRFTNSANSCIISKLTRQQPRRSRMHNGHLVPRNIKLMISTRGDRSPLLLFFAHGRENPGRFAYRPAQAAEDRRLSRKKNTSDAVRSSRYRKAEAPGKIRRPSEKMLLIHDIVEELVYPRSSGVEVDVVPAFPVHQRLGFGAGREMNGAEIPGVPLVHGYDVVLRLRAVAADRPEL